MQRGLFTIVATGLLIAGPAALQTGAAEIRLRCQCETSAVVLTLGELAEIFSNDSRELQQLTAVELGPAPTPGQQRFVRVREIQDALWARGISLPAHQFTGYGLITVRRVMEPAPVEKPLPVAEYVAPKPAAEKKSSTVDTRRATEQVQQALQAYLQSRNAEPGNIDFQLSDAQARAVLADGAAVTVSGGMPPWTRAQRLELIVTNPQGESRSSLDVRVASSVAVVVPLHALPRGAVLRPEDVQVTQASFTTAVPRQLPRTLDEVVGRETVRPLPEGRPLSSDALRSPILIRRGEMVTVFAQAPGVKVKSQARARDDAGLGEQLTVETLPDSKPLLARATGPQEAEACGAPPPSTDRSRRPGASHRERSAR
jgi:flagella basal body P-ring formation protein FlgA